MYQKYANSFPGSKEFIFYSFFAAYLNQDVESLEEGISSFKTDHSKEDIALLVEAIDEFIALPYPEKEKGKVISAFSSNIISSADAAKELEFIRDSFNELI